MVDPTPQQALAAARALAVAGTLGVHPRCTPGLRLLQLEPNEAVKLIAGATMSQIVKSEHDNDPTRPYWTLELSILHPNSPTGLIYAKPVLRLPALGTGYILQFKPSTDA